MNTYTNHTHTEVDTHLTHLTAGLLHYAETNTAFARWLASCTATTMATDSVTDTLPPAHPVFIPHNERVAYRKACWLTDTPLPAHNMARYMIAQWARDQAFESPKAIVLGIDVGVLPIGVMGKMKRKYEPMDLLIRRDVAAHTDLHAVRTLTQVTHSVLEQELRRAHGNTRHLAPETNDWLFGDKQLALHAAPFHALEQIRTFAQNTAIPHAHVADDRGLRVLALSPTVYLYDLPHAESLTALRD